MRYGYAVTPEANGEGITATFDGLPGATEARALAMAEDMLVSALGFYVDDGKPLPRPGPALGQRVVSVPPLVAAKPALVSNVELGRRLGVDEKAVRRLRDPLHRCHIGQVEAAPRLLGKLLEVTVMEAAR